MIRKNPYSVSQVNTYIKNMFAQDYLLSSILVRGEVSNCKYHSSGHIYFTLKDASGTLSCIMFAGRRRGLSFTMKEGDQVIVQGSVEVYERDGKYQLYAERILQDGIGLLNERYEQLKKRLEEQGMFDEHYKQPIPRFIRTLGVVTAPTGAAVRDIINIAHRRNPYVQIILYPALVQGDGAASSIVSGIHALEQLGVDVMIIGRGGGSLEDLWAFNEKVVAQAVFDCAVPVISAVGHETDTVITDYVADLRAPTPSAAAELAVYDLSAYEEMMTGYRGKLDSGMKHHLLISRNRTQSLARELKALSPEARLREQRMKCIQGRERLDLMMKQRLQLQKHSLQLKAAGLESLSPVRHLAAGYTYLTDETGKNIKSVREVHRGELVGGRLTDGRMLLEVREILRQNDESNDINS